MGYEITKKQKFLLFRLFVWFVLQCETMLSNPWRVISAESGFVDTVLQCVDLRRRKASAKIARRRRIGKRDKPMEFGHKIFLSETKEKFILDYKVFLQSPSDTTLLEPAVERHAELFLEYPSGVAGDKGFHPGKDEFDGLVDDYDGKVKYFGVPGRLRDFGDALRKTGDRKHHSR